eukprot:TRINITY_DN14074_c0_g1_i5.p1 TRINITY_DN14074_c0_g1~~TRINITY_DN14074_c0_g1_i5.p1  ORF type:complete len:279 (+),score=60.20 TRINITY_DN14074_c0_g1_i5:98-934(+)
MCIRDRYQRRVRGPPGSIMSAHRLFVVGGTGFIGRAICRAAVQHGAAVTSLSRSGAPELSEPWMEKVEWMKGDALDATTYQDQARNSTALVHAVGSLFADGGYKRMLGKSTPAGAASAQRGRTAAETLNITNRDTALRLAEACDDGVDRTFLFLSAATLPPFADPAYLSSKREVESVIRAQQNLKHVIFRAGLVYGEAEPVSMSLAAGLHMLDSVARTLKPLAPTDVQAVAKTLYHDVYAKPMSVLTLGQAAVQAVVLQEKGTFSPEEIGRLAQCAGA